MSFKMLAVSAAAAAAFVASGASLAASTTLYGGGATLPAIAYVGTSFFSTNTRLTNPADTGSLFGSFAALTGVTVSYCQTGSGFGRNVIEGNSNASLACPTTFNDAVGTTTTGFSASTSSANFAASDAPLGASDYATFLLKRPDRTEPVQVPELAGSIAIVYKNAAVVGHLPLTDSQICGIFGGTITNWSQLGYAAKAITVVYRTDGSGTSFGFSNHLSAVCGTLGFASPNNYNTTTTFTGAFPGGKIPTGAIGASGNPGVMNVVAATDGAIGYGETADAVERAAAGVAYATVNGFDPLSSFSSSLKITSSTVLVDQVLGANDANGRPTTTAVSAPVAGCIQLVNPNSYANPTGTYPITAVTYLMGYYSGNGADYTNVQTLLGAAYNSTIKGTTNTVGAGTGFAYITSYNPAKASRRAPSILGKCINQ